MWLVGMVSRRWVWLVGGIYGYGYHVYILSLVKAAAEYIELRVRHYARRAQS